MTLVKIPEHLRAALWGWSWNKRSWPGKFSQFTPADEKKLKALEDAIMEDPSARHFYQRAKFLVECGQYESALNDYYQCVHEKPNEKKYRAERADLFLLLGKDDEAINDYLLLQGKISENKLLLKLSYLYLLQGNYFEAQFYLGRFHELEPANSYSELLDKYLSHVKIISAQRMKRIQSACEVDYTEENLLWRAETKEKVFDLVGAVEDYIMLYLLFEREKYQLKAAELKLKVLAINSKKRKSE